MNLRNLLLTGAALLMASPMFASTYFGGFEDSVGSDYDYNDLVFSISGNGLSLNTYNTGQFYGKPDLSVQNANPFWNNASLDGAKYNVGFCIYGGGNCNGGTGLDPQASFLASRQSPAESVTNFSFHIDDEQSIYSDIYLSIAADQNKLGWYSLNDSKHKVHIIDTATTTGVYQFDPDGDFGLVGIANGNDYYSQISLGNNGDCKSHFAMFATPEPGSMSLIAGGLIAFGTLMRRRKQA